MDFKTFENYIYLEIFYINLDIIILRKFKDFWKKIEDFVNVF
jgi:hypothetical protein